MSSGLTSLYKILKDETRSKTILILHEKGAMSYTDLMNALEIITTGLMNYHLKVLGDLLEKTDNGQYRLNAKGQLAYQVLTQFPNGQPPVTDPRIYKSWIIFTVASVIIAVLNGYFLHIPVEDTALVVTILLLATGFAFYIRIRPSTEGNRVFYIAVGAFCLGFVFWFLLESLLLFSGLRWQILSSTGNVGDDFAALASLVVCWILGGWIGDLIGKKRNYNIPMLRV